MKAHETLEIIPNKPLKMKAMKVYMNIDYFLRQNQLLDYHERSIFEVNRFRRTTGKETETEIVAHAISLRSTHHDTKHCGKTALNILNNSKSIQKKLSLEYLVPLRICFNSFPPKLSIYFNNSILQCTYRIITFSASYSTTIDCTSPLVSIVSRAEIILDTWGY